MNDYEWISIEEKGLPECAGSSFDKEWIVTDGVKSWVTSQHPMRWNMPDVYLSDPAPMLPITHWMPCDTPRGLPVPPGARTK